jgi:S1-C subfamily serine protease
MTHFVWTCPRCARSVPHRLDVCRCGCPRGDIEAFEAPLAARTGAVAPAAPVLPPSDSAWTASPHRLLLVAVAAGLVIMATGVAVFRSSPASDARRKPSAATLAAQVPAAESALPDVPPLDDTPPSPRLDAVVPAAAAAAEPMSLLSTEELVTRSMPAVVTVMTRDGLGSGFFVATDTVVTNAHVVRGSAMVTLKRSGGYSRSARVEDVSDSIDLAILKVDVPDLEQIVLPLAMAADVHVGGEVVAIGSPLGLANSVTRGIVSGMREIDGVRLIQTDAAINPGNSGGPLLDRYGRVLGVNTMKLAARGVESLAFSVSIDYVRRMLGTKFAPTTEWNRRQSEDGMRDYGQNLRVLAQQADAIDVNWKRFHASCTEDDGPPVVERGWFALRDGARAPMRDSASCRSWLDYFKEAAVKTHDALRRYELSARAAGVSADQLRVIRRRHAMIWPAWES